MLSCINCIVDVYNGLLSPLYLPVCCLPQLKDVTEQIGQLSEAITAASAAVGKLPLSVGSMTLFRATPGPCMRVWNIQLCICLMAAC